MIEFGGMNTNEIVAALIAERDRLNVAIGALQGGSSITAKRRGRPPKNAAAPSAASSVASPQPAAVKKARKKRTFTPAQRREISKRMKARWAAKKTA